MKKNYCGNCGKEIRLKEILTQSIMFGIYCEKCGEISKASKGSKIIFLILFAVVLILNIISPMNGIVKIIVSMIWCILALWIIQPFLCNFE